MPETGQWVFGTRAEIMRRLNRTVSREELVRRMEGALSPQDVVRLDRAEGDELEARWILGPSNDAYPRA